MKKTMIIALTAFAITSQCMAAEEQFNNENGVGFIHTHEMERQKEDVRDEYFIDRLGLVRVPGNMIQPKQVRPEPSEQANKLLSELRNIEDLHSKRKFVEAEERISLLKKSYPELQPLYTWDAIYSELAGKHKESREMWENLRMTFPLDEGGAEENFYKARSFLLEKDLPNATAEIEKGLKKKTAFSGTVTNPNVIGNAFLYLALKSEPEPSVEKIEKLWARLTPEEREHLENYYGFDLTELWLWRGDAMNQPKWLKKYIETERANEAEEIIKNVREASRILYSRW